MSKTYIIRRPRTTPAPATPAPTIATTRPSLTHTYLEVQFDLVDEMQWEDRAQESGLFLSLEEAGLEESQDGDSFDCSGAFGHAEWFYDGDESAFSPI